MVVRSGVYRERVAPARGGVAGRPISFEAAPGATVFLRGSEEWKPRWQAVGGGLVRGQLDQAVFGAYNPFALKCRDLKGNLTQGQVFLDGKRLREVDSREDLVRLAGSWKSEMGRSLTLHLPEGVSAVGGHLVEVSVRRQCFAPKRRGLGYITIRGFTIEQCASDSDGGFWDQRNPPQMGQLSTRSGHHWTIESNVIRNGKAVGIDCGSERGGSAVDGQATPDIVGFHLIRRNVVSDNGLCGITGIRHIGTKVLGNVIERNNCLHFNAVEEGGIKFHALIDGLIASNLVRDNEADGIWLDNGWTGTRITRNLCINNRNAGIFVELGQGPILVDNNILCYTRPGTYEPDPRGDGFYTHDASGVTFAHNLTFGNASFGIYLRQVTDRWSYVYPPHMRTFDVYLESRVGGVAGMQLLQNVIGGNAKGAICLQPTSDPDRPNLSDRNLFLGEPRFAVWERGSKSLAEFLAKVGKNSLPLTDGRNMTDPLDLGTWRSTMSCDGGSVAGPGAASIEGDMLRIQLPQASLPYGTFAVYAADTDLLGRRLESGRAHPGPIQGLKPGANRVRIWPVPVLESTKPLP